MLWCLSRVFVIICIMPAATYSGVRECDDWFVSDVLSSTLCFGLYMKEVVRPNTFDQSLDAPLARTQTKSI